MRPIAGSNPALMTMMADEDWMVQEQLRTPIHPGDHIDLEWLSQFPLSTRGRYIVNKNSERFRLRGVNWYGGSDASHALGGLDVQRLEVICGTVKSLGFNVVRLPFSNEMLRSEVRPGSIDYSLNPQLRGLSALQVFDEVIRCLGEQSVAVIINNHTTYGEWCGPPSKNSLWFDPGSPYTEERWMDDWAALASRYSLCKYVVGFDLRNEIRPCVRGWPKIRSTDDWARAARQVSERLLTICPQALIIVERIVWPQRGIMKYATSPGPLLPALQGRLVLSVHHYSWSGPGRFVPRWYFPNKWQWASETIRFAGLITRTNYGDMDRDTLKAQIMKEWGSVLEANLCPVWVSEFGANSESEEEMAWFEAFNDVLGELDADWAYWPLNVGPKPSCGSDETYGMIGDDWRPKKTGDVRLDVMTAAGLMSSSSSSSFAGATTGHDLVEDNTEVFSDNALQLQTLPRTRSLSQVLADSMLSAVGLLRRGYTNTGSKDETATRDQLSVPLNTSSQKGPLSLRKVGRSLLEMLGVNFAKGLVLVTVPSWAALEG